MAVFILTLLSLLLLAIYGVLIGWYQRAWMGARVYPSVVGLSVQRERVKISVLVPARNEEENIAACLESLLTQRYPADSFEIIVIDDHSSDTTAAIVLRYAQHKKTGAAIRLIRLSEVYAEKGGPVVSAHKKYAIETGIHAATGALIVTTDADCLFDPHWLETIGSFYETMGAKFIAAPVRIGGAFPGMGGKGSERRGVRGLEPAQGVLAIFQTLDFITLQGITGAAVSKRMHSMCNGANLAYEKKAFFEVDGFRDIDSIPSGDDMFLMHKIYLRYPGKVFFCKNREAIVSTAAERRVKGFIHQRVRWASKADRYDDKRIFWVLLLVWVINFLFLVLGVAAFWNSWFLWLLLIMLVLKTMVEYPFVRSVAGFFEQQGLMVYFPAMQPLHIMYTVVIGWLGKFGSYQWKERKITK